MDVMSVVWETTGQWAAQRAKCGRVKAKLGPEDESVSLSRSREGNVGNEALHVTGLHGPGGKIAFFLAGLGAGEGGIELSHGPGHVVPGSAWGLVAGLPLPRGPLSHEKPSSQRGRAVTKKEREGCGEKIKEEGT